MSGSGTHHIPRPSEPTKAYCGAPIRKPIMDRRHECPQCARVRKREGGKKS